MKAWREIGNVGDPYPDWLRALHGKSGVYGIREKGLLGGPVLYVGESHTGNLDKTLTRHFQSWNRSKRHWKGAFRPEQTDPGHTYHRARVEVAVEVVPRNQAVRRQNEMIHKLKPRDNEIEAVPF